MIKIEIHDIDELKNLPIIPTSELRMYLEKRYPKLYAEAMDLSWGSYVDIDEILQYISENEDIGNIHEVFMVLGAGITATYGYVIE